MCQSSDANQQMDFDDKQNRSIWTNSRMIVCIMRIRFVPPLCRGGQRARREHVVFCCNQRSHLHWRYQMTARHCVGMDDQKDNRVVWILHDIAMISASTRPSYENLTKTVISCIRRSGQDESASSIFPTAQLPDNDPLIAQLRCQ